MTTVRKAGRCSAFSFTPGLARGFTLVELVVVILLVGILAFSAIPRFDAFLDIDFVGYRDQLRSVLRFAQKTAIAQRRQTLVEYARNSVTLCSEPFSATPVCPVAPLNCAVGGRTALEVPGGLFRPGPPAVTATGVVCFNARGEAYGGAGGIDLDGGGADITVVAATGLVQ